MEINSEENITETKLKFGAERTHKKQPAIVFSFMLQPFITLKC